MVSPWCPFLFYKKEIFKFSEVSMVSVYCNCLIRCIVIMRGCGLKMLPTLQRIFACLPKTAIQTLKQNAKFVQYLFINHLTALRPNLGHWQGGNFTNKRLSQKYFKYHPTVTRSIVSCNEVGSQSLTERISRIWVRNLPVLSVTWYPTSHSPQKCTRTY